MRVLSEWVAYHRQGAGLERVGVVIAGRRGRRLGHQIHYIICNTMVNSMKISIKTGKKVCLVVSIRLVQYINYVLCTMYDEVYTI